MSEKSIFITGTSSGLGYGLALNYLNKEFQVLGCSRREAPKELSQNENYFHLSIDLTIEDDLHFKLFPFLKKQKPIGLAILNAGALGEIKDLSEMNLDELKSLMDVNLWANKNLIDRLSQNSSKLEQIVGVSSGASVNGNRGWGNYSLTKAALNMLFKVYAKEIPSVHFCSLAPGLIDTAMQDYLTGLPHDDRFDTIERLREAKGTESMPKPVEAGRLIAEAIEKARKHPSGSFLDVRNDI